MSEDPLDHDVRPCTTVERLVGFLVRHVAELLERWPLDGLFVRHDQVPCLGLRYVIPVMRDVFGDQLCDFEVQTSFNMKIEKLGYMERLPRNGQTLNDLDIKR